MDKRILSFKYFPCSSASLSIIQFLSKIFPHVTCLDHGMNWRTMVRFEQPGKMVDSGIVNMSIHLWKLIEKRFSQEMEEID